MAGRAEGLTGPSAADRIYRRLVRSPHGQDVGDGVAEQVRDRVGGNGLRHLVASTCQSAGDQVVNAKTVLPWLLTTVGAPGVLLGLLVPIREAGSMLPQAGMTPWLARRAERRWWWVLGAVGQAVSVTAMAALALLAEGLVAGLGIVAALTVFATCRALSSLSGKDVLGRTIPKGQRGQINGLVTMTSGLAAIALGVGLGVFGGEDLDTAVLAALLAVAAVSWLVGAVVFAGIREPAADVEEGGQGSGWARRAVAALRGDQSLRRFVAVRALLLVSALSPPFVVAMAAADGGAGLGGLGPFVIAQGVAGVVGGRVFGRWADRSSRRVMVAGALVASSVVLGFLVLAALPATESWALLYPATYLLLALVHTGVRVARKTYVVDVAGDERRTEYIAVSNSAIGLLLLLTGAVSGALATLGSEVALAFLAALGLAGAVLGRSLPEVELRSADGTV